MDDLGLGRLDPLVSSKEKITSNKLTYDLFQFARNKIIIYDSATMGFLHDYTSEPCKTVQSLKD
jgi:hypothetical protein